jgi:hypothetical protein
VGCGIVAAQDAVLRGYEDGVFMDDDCAYGNFARLPSGDGLVQG